MNRITRLAAVALAMGSMACSEAAVQSAEGTAQPQTTPQAQTIPEIASADGRFDTLVGALTDTGLASTLSQPGPFTVFAPTDAAFDLLPAGLLAGLSTGQLADILRYHVVAGEVRAADVVGLTTAPTAEGSEIDVQVVNGTVVLDGRVQVTTTDIVASNGVIHVVDAVLVPGDFPGTVVDALVASPRFDTLTGAVGDAGLVDTLAGDGPFTVLAPTNDAFARLPDGLVAGLDAATLGAVLTYHVIPVLALESTVVGLAEAPTVQGSNVPIQIDPDDGALVLDGRVQVTFTDIVTSNGVIHVVDAVLVPGAFPGTIVDVLAASPRFDDLVGAVVAEDLAGTLATSNGGDGFTVFAPTNAAFARLPAGLVDSLSSAGALGSVLLYHVLGSTVDSGGAVAADGSTVPTLATDPSGAAFLLAVDLDADRDLFLDGRTEVVFTDIAASNGVIHVLDSVLVPGGDFPGTLVEALTSYPRFDTLVGAVVAEDLVGAITGVTVFAPTNDAFADTSLPSGFTLAEVLAYHVLATPTDSASLAPVETTLQGNRLFVDTSHGVVLNRAVTVTRADIVADDGILHVIDGVLDPAH